jgi:ABC-type nickel/cobalt efflux system permease component RcnA
MFALQWFYLIYLLPLGLAVLYLGVYVASGWTFGDHDVDAGHDLDAGHDVEVDHDLQIGHDIEVGHDVDHVHVSESRSSTSEFRAMAWLGVGKVPMSLVLMVLLMTFGFLGFASNRMLDEVLSGAMVLLASLPIAVVGSLVLTGLVSNAMAKWMPLDQSFAVRAKELVGQRATLLYDLVPGQTSIAIVRDGFGNRHQITVVGEHSIAKNTELVLVGFDEASRRYRAVAFGAISDDRVADPARESR